MCVRRYSRQCSYRVLCHSTRLFVHMHCMGRIPSARIRSLAACISAIGIPVNVIASVKSHTAILCRLACGRGIFISTAYLRPHTPALGLDHIASNYKRALGVQKTCGEAFEGPVRCTPHAHTCVLRTSWLVSLSRGRWPRVNRRKPRPRNYPRPKSL